MSSWSRAASQIGKEDRLCAPAYRRSSPFQLLVVVSDVDIESLRAWPICHVLPSERAGIPPGFCQLLAGGGVGYV